MNMDEKGSNEGSNLIDLERCYIYPPCTIYRLILGQQKLRTAFLQGREDDAARSKTSTNTINVEHSYKVKAILNSKSYYFTLARLLLDVARSKTSTNTINVEHSYKVKAILNSKSYYFPLARLLLGLYDYKLKHISIFDYNNDRQHDQTHNNQSRGRLLFQEREDDADIPTDQAVTQVDEHNIPININ
jgi:hypothetical protein